MSKCCQNDSTTQEHGNDARGHGQAGSPNGVFAVQTERPRPKLRSSGLATRDGKLVKSMGPGEPKPLTAVLLGDDDDEHSLMHGWIKMWERLRGFLRR